MNLRFSKQAVEDLKRLKSFIACKNPIAAERTSNKLADKIETLTENPKIGIAVPGDTTDSIRDLHADDYTVRYIENSTELFILKIWHDKENMLEDLELAEIIELRKDQPEIEVNIDDL